MKKLLLATVAALAPVAASAQTAPACGLPGLPKCGAPFVSGLTFMPSQQTFGLSAASPGSSCSVNGSVYGSATALYQCRGGTWTAVGGGGLTVGTTSIAGGASGRLLYDNAGVLGEELSTALSILPGQITQSGATTGQVLGWSGTAWAPTSAGSSGLTIGTTPITGGTSGYVLEDVSGVLQNIATETADALPAATTPNGTDTVLAHQSGTTTVAMTLSNLASYVASTISGVVTEIIDGAGNIATGNVTFWGTHKSGSTIIEGGLFDVSAGVPPLSAWTQVGISGSTSINQGSYGSITIKDAGTNSVSLHGISIPAPTAPYKIAILVQANALDINYFSIVAGWTDGTKIEALERWNSYVGTDVGRFSDYTTRTSFSTVTNPLFSAQTFCFILSDDGTTVSYGLSSDCVNAAIPYQVAKTSGYLGGSGYSNIFVGLLPDGTQSASINIRAYTVNPGGLP